MEDKKDLSPITMNTPNPQSPKKPTPMNKVPVPNAPAKANKGKKQALPKMFDAAQVEDIVKHAIATTIGRMTQVQSQVRPHVPPMIPHQMMSRQVMPPPMMQSRMMGPPQGPFHMMPPHPMQHPMQHPVQHQVSSKPIDKRQINCRYDSECRNKLTCEFRHRKEDVLKWKKETAEQVTSDSPSVTPSTTEEKPQVPVKQNPPFTPSTRSPPPGKPKFTLCKADSSCEFKLKCKFTHKKEDREKWLQEASPTEQK